MRKGGEKIIVALDTPDVRQACRWARTLSDQVGAFKLGLEFLYSGGPQGVNTVNASAGGSRIFIDGKFSDIPTTVARAVKSTCALRPWLMNVHAMAGIASMEAAAKASKDYADMEGCERSLVIAVTILTSLNLEALQRMGVNQQSVETTVRILAGMAQDSGLDGVVASPHEVQTIRRYCGHEFLIITPGIRPTGTDTQDQIRLATPGVAIRNGADYLVIGRAITNAANPVTAVDAIAEEVEKALES